MKQLSVFLFFLIPFFLFSQQSPSVLSGGDWFKISVVETGVHQISYDDLVDYGINPDQIDPQNIAIYGNPAGMLPETYSTPSYLGLSEMAIEVVGEEDGIFDAGDFILFYGQSPIIWTYDPETKHFHHALNYYTDETYYYLTIGETAGKRVEIQPGTALPYTAIIDEYDLLIYHELDSLNLAKSGKQWLGETFQDEESLSFEFDFSGYSLQPSNHYFKAVAATKSTEPGTISVNLNDDLIRQMNMPVVPGNNSYQHYRSRNFDTLINIDGPDFTLDFDFEKPNDSAQAWLDYFEFNLKIGQYFNGDLFSFRTTKNVGVDSVSLFNLKLDTPDDFVIWDVTNPLNVSSVIMDVVQPNQVSFVLETDEVLEFQGFNGNEFYSPAFVEQVDNQNLASMSPPEYLIITHPNFSDAASTLKDFYDDDLNTTVVTTDQINNEFATGTADVTAIRDFIWYLRETSGEENEPAYVLLLGDASYDYKDRIENNSNFVPTFESLESGNAITSFATDRYFSMKNMLGQNEEQISVGRLPVSTIEEANTMVSKIEHYSSENTLGAWKNETMFIADDGDNNLHQRDAEYLIGLTEAGSPVYNNTKTYFDFFELMQNDDGPRYPEVNTQIEQNMNEGVFYVNYTGHGSNTVLATEQVLTIPEITDWNNPDALPLWIIASTDVARYDDPGQISLGESILLLEDVGAISVLSNSRATFASSNLMQNTKVVEKLMDESLQAGLRFGDIFNNPVDGNNDLKWNLLGDPALEINFPEFLVSTLKVNDVDIELFEDTISPGSLVKINGQIEEKKEQILQNWFNGTVYLKVFAPAYQKETNGNQNPAELIWVQDSILTTAITDVVNGEFEIEISLPALYYEGFGNLKLSWYAANMETDANGFNSQIVFGGEPSALDEFEEIAGLIKAYPSPFQSYINIDLPDLKSEKYLISVYSMMGNKVYETQTREAELLKVDLSFLPAGLYLLNVNSNMGSKKMKILKN